MAEKENTNKKGSFSVFGCCSREDDSKTEVIVPSGQMPPEEEVKVLSPPTYPPSNLYNIRYSLAPRGIVVSKFQPMGGKENSTAPVELRSDTLKPYHPSPVNAITSQTSQFKIQPVVYRVVQQQPIQFVGSPT